MFTNLPNDVLICIFQFLSPVELAHLSLACSVLYHLVNEYGWSAYLRAHLRPSQSLSRARARWPARLRAKYDYLTDEAWHNNSFVARPLSHPWQGKSSPLLIISQNRLIVASGTTLHSFTFGTSGDESNTSPPVSFEASFSLSSEHSPCKEITGVTLVSSDGFNDVLFVAFQDSVIERISILASDGITPPSITRHHASTIPDSDPVESLSSASDLLLSLSLNGSVKLANHRDLTSSVGLNWNSTVDLKARSWASYLCLSSSTPYAAFGTSNRSAPLPIYTLPYHQFSSSIPSLLLTSGSRSNSPVTTSSSAVYGLSQAPPSSPWGSSPQILVAGWYDSKVRCYDLRTPTSSSIPFQSSDSLNGTPSSSLVSVPALNPVLSLHNPWSYEPIYSVSCGGGSGSFIAAGAARHSVLSFWDIRSPKGGWSVHAPGNDTSPVYSVILESSRCFGATERRPFVYDFGPGVIIDTYPPITRVRGDKLKFDKSSGRKGVDYYVTKYPHSRGNIFIDH
ncbi:hypothetical protein AGABI1DRAFT_74517 [Agaricus bisporus var. burnettii JB137-S8]|uniref:F-box domain-containing protein n=1 Tax=Agaricus bisporus var. burnettii (strain JB137-S8 / ATCC MYA-4627 / FGSC 10392) TaxID=597362 RepID=K5VY95_AGABU|nr:uncharacterized protein AGABI1DRAFT_74517 [Agaricus bisporus var. burnettii JB137-S8]EKM79459.1 hypothetical protein AGABI1DRAFT_74517 [Agaricus bisporus var. burnettii JB137-S8]